MAGSSRIFSGEGIKNDLEGKKLCVREKKQRDIGRYEIGTIAWEELILSLSLLLAKAAPV